MSMSTRRHTRRHKHSRQHGESSSRNWSPWEWSAEHGQSRRYSTDSAGVRVWQYELELGDDLASTTNTTRYVPETTIEQNDLPPIHDVARSAHTCEYEVEYGEAGGEQPQSTYYRESDGRTYGDISKYPKHGRDSYQEEMSPYTQPSQIQRASSTEYCKGDMSGTVSQMRLQDEENYGESLDEDPKPLTCNQHGCVNGPIRNPGGFEPRPHPTSGSKSEVERSPRHQSGGSRRSKEDSSDKTSSRSGGKKNERRADQETPIDSGTEIQVEVEKWEKEWQTWRDVTCACGHGYYTKEAQWISGQKVRDGLAPPKPADGLYLTRFSGSIGVQ